MPSPRGPTAQAARRPMPLKISSRRLAKRPVRTAGRGGWWASRGASEDPFPPRATARPPGGGAQPRPHRIDRQPRGRPRPPGRPPPAAPARQTGALVQPSAKGMQRLGGARVRRRDPHRRFELAKRLPPLTLFEKNPSQIHVGKLPGLVPLGLLGPLEPGDRLVELVLLHQVDADVVIG